MSNKIHLKISQIGTCFGILLILFAGCVALIPTSFTEQPPQESTFVVINFTAQVNATPEIPDPMPVSEYIREYNMTKTGGIWRAINGSSYIDPDHEVVQWYARNTILNKTGLYYFNDKLVRGTFHPDFNHENEDYWLNADYYLSHGLYGDCEDLAIGINSILEAKNVPNMFVCISDRKKYLHAYTEYYFEGEYYVVDFEHPIYQLREDKIRDKGSEVWMFNIDHDYMTYNKNWIEIY